MLKINDFPRLVVMSFHPLSGEFSRQIELACGPIHHHYDAADLRKLPWAAGVRQLFALRCDKLLIALEGDTSTALIGPLSIAAAFTRASEIEVIWPDLRREQIRRLSGLGKLWSALYSTFASRMSLRRATGRATRLLNSPMPRSISAGDGTRVLYLDANISLGPSVGGSVGHTAGVIEGFLDHSFHVDYASLKPLPTRREGVEHVKLRPETLLAIPPELNFYPYGELIERTIPDQHRLKPWSFIYQRFSLHNFSGVRLGRRLKIPVIVEFNGSEVWTAENWGRKLALHDAALAAESAALRGADLLITVSDELGRDLRRRGIPDERIVVYPNCVDPNQFSPLRFSSGELGALRRRHGIPDDALVAGFLGTFGQWHGVEFLAKCIRNLVRDDVGWIEKSKLHFMLVGDGEKMPAVRQLLSSLPSSRYVTLVGLVPQSEAAKYLACSDLLISPHVPNADGTIFFGSPTKLFEYMAMQKPIVAAALGQIEDVIAGRGATEFARKLPGAGRPCGFLFEPGNATDFTKTLRRVVDDMPAAGELAKDARVEVLNRYTWERHVNAILAGMLRNGLLSRRLDGRAA